MITVALHESIQGRLLAGVAWFSNLDASEEHPFWPEMEALGATLRRIHAGRQPSGIPGLDPARRLYRAFGIDPTRTRPSSEALLRRVLQEKELYRINRLVDAVNWASLSLLLPIGLYDLDRVEGDLTLRVGLPGEAFEGIRRGEIHVEGRLVVADAKGACGSPTADSLRTSASPATRRAVGIVFAPGDYPPPALEEGLARFAGQVAAWCGGIEEGSRVLGGDR